MSMLSKTFTPVVVALEISASCILRLLGAKNVSENQVTEAEVKAVLSEGAQSGVIEKTEHEILQRVIRLGDRDVKSIMTHRTDLTMLKEDDDMDDIVSTIHNGRHSHYPVCASDGDHIIGIVHAKELLDGVFTGGVIDIHSFLRPVQAVPESSSCLQVMELFKKTDLNFAIVVDEYGTTEGIVTSSDILEAIIGVLPSNYNEGDHKLIIEREDGSWLVDGRTPIDEIQMSIGIEDIDTDEDFETIAGFLLHELGQPPQEGDVLERYNYRFEVIDMDNRRIDKILVSFLGTPDDTLVD